MEKNISRTIKEVIRIAEKEGALGIVLVSWFFRCGNLRPKVKFLDQVWIVS